MKLRTGLLRFSSLILMVALAEISNGPSSTVSAQEPEGAAALTVRLRAADGTTIVGETVTLQRLPDEADIAPLCKTDMLGACTWYVERGLYQVLFVRSPDEVSALALAEGGLRGYGLTVGERAVTYYFTFHSDGHVYFDDAPHAAMPVPVIPTAEHLHGGAEAIAMPEATVMPTATIVVNSSEDDEGGDERAPEPEEHEAAIGGRWRLLMLVATGLMAGSGLHWWTRRRQRQSSNADFRAASTVGKPVDREQDHA